MTHQETPDLSEEEEELGGCPFQMSVAWLKGLIESIRKLTNR